MKRWLVTGGVGFIGYHLSRSLLARGDSLTIVDDFSSAPYPVAMKNRNAEDLKREFPEVEIVRGCITDRELMTRVVDGKSGVFHLAGLAGVRPSFADPARYARVNMEGTATLADAAERA